MRHVDLCSGIGGFALGFQWAGLSEPVQFCDIEAWSRKVLAKHWPDVPIAEDVKELASDPARLVPDCDILTAGYPCQPFSVAGLQRGAADDRHIWPEIFTIVQAKQPTWCVFENVSGHISLGLDQVLSDLEGKGYAVQPFVVPACALDAPHRRDRVWIIASHADSESQSDVTGHGEEGQWVVGNPDTLDHLPQRSAEALKKQATSQRKGRTRPANLREQVNPETVEAWNVAQQSGQPKMWATPTAAVSQGTTRPPSKGGGSRDLRQDVRMWPTPRASEYKDTGPWGASRTLT